MSARPDSYHIVLQGEAPDTIFAWICWLLSLIGWLAIPLAPVFAVPGVVSGVIALKRIEHRSFLAGRDLVRIGITSCLVQLLVWSAIFLLILNSIPQRILVRHVLIPG
jgi:hypothetical protein